MFRLNFLVSLTILSVCLYNGSANAKFPNDPKPCKYGDTECIKNVINYLLREKSDGESSLNLVKLDPLRVPQIRIAQGEESPVNIDLTFIQNDILGLKNLECIKVKGFDKDPTKKSELRFKVPSITLAGDYKISGKVLILPINGLGKSNITMVNTEFSLVFTGTKFEKDGATYMKITNMKMNTKPERLYYKFDNLFNGDKALGDNMNLFLNENWQDIFNEVKDSFHNAFARIFEAVITNVFAKLPYEKLFAE